MRCEYHDLISDMIDQNQPAAAPTPEVEPYIVGLRPIARPSSPSSTAASAKSGDENLCGAVQRLELDLQEIQSLLRELLLLRSASLVKNDAPTLAK